MSQSEGPALDVDRRIHISFFPPGLNVPTQRDVPLSRLLDSLTGRIWLPVVCGDGHDLDQCTAAISGGRYPEGASRCRDEVVDSQMVVLDIPNAQPMPTGEYWADLDGTVSDRPKTRLVGVEDPISFTDALGRLSDAGIAGTGFTATEHTPEMPWTRLMVPLAKPVPRGLWPAATDSVLEALNLHRSLLHVDFHSARNPAGKATLPTPPRYWPLLQRRVDGRLLDLPIETLRGRTLFRVPVPTWLEALNQVRAERAPSLPALPEVDPAELVAELGCHVFPERSMSSGTGRRTTCPWATEHVAGMGDDSAVVLYHLDQPPTWRCIDPGHTHMGVADLLQVTGRL